MSEMQQTADHLLVIGRGRLIADGSTSEIIAGSTQQAVRVRSPRADVMAQQLVTLGAAVERIDDRELLVSGVSAERIGDLAHEMGAALHELAELHSSLEQAYMELTASSLEYIASRPAAGTPDGGIRS